MRRTQLFCANAMAKHSASQPVFVSHTMANAEARERLAPEDEQSRAEQSRAAAPFYCRACPVVAAACVIVLRNPEMAQKLGARRTFHCFFCAAQFFFLGRFFRCT